MTSKDAMARQVWEPESVRSTLEIALLMSLSILATLASIAASGLKFVHAESFFALFGALLFALIALNIYQSIRMPNNKRMMTFVNMTIIYLIMSVTFMTFQYSLALYKAYPISNNIEAVDRSIGFVYLDFITKINSYPYVSEIIGFCYKNWMREFVVVFVALSYFGKFQDLHELTLCYIIAGMSTLAVSGLLDARSFDGVAAYAVAGLHHPSGVSPDYLKKLDHLRLGLDSVMDFNAIVGLVSFPSFHAGAAVLLATATRTLKWLWFPFLGFNILILIGTITEGGHNFMDVIFGCLFAVGAIAAAQAFRGSTLTSALAVQVANRFPPSLRPRAQ